MTEFWLAYRVGRAEAIQQSHSGGSFLIFFFIIIKQFSSKHEKQFSKKNQQAKRLRWGLIQGNFFRLKKKI